MVPFLSHTFVEKRSIKNRWMQRSHLWVSDPRAQEGTWTWEVLLLTLPCQLIWAHQPDTHHSAQVLCLITFSANG